MNKSLSIISSLFLCAALSGNATPEPPKTTPAEKAQTTHISGAGSSFIYPLLSQWIHSYKQEYDIRIDYQPTGSQDGIQLLKQHQVDFAASDKPFRNDHLSNANFIQFPIAIGGIAVCVNLPEVPHGKIILDSKTLGNIYTGVITKWNDEELQDLNKDIGLPDRTITVIHHTSGSGTAFNFTRYLKKSHVALRHEEKDWKVLKWPTGITGESNEEIAQYIQEIPFSIGYVDFAYAQRYKLNTVQLINRNGKTVSPSIYSFLSATADIDWTAKNNFHQLLLNQPGDNSWPITTATMILMQGKCDDKQRTLRTLQFFKYCLLDGKTTAQSLDYIPIPDVIADRIFQYWKDNITDTNGDPIWTEQIPTQDQTTKNKTPG